MDLHIDRRSSHMGNYCVSCGSPMAALLTSHRSGRVWAATSTLADCHSTPSGVFQGSEYLQKVPKNGTAQGKTSNVQGSSIRRCYAAAAPRKNHGSSIRRCFCGRRPAQNPHSSVTPQSGVVMRPPPRANSMPCGLLHQLQVISEKNYLLAM